MSNSISATTLEQAPLEAVYIYFDTATYDEIERDEKVQHYRAFRSNLLIWNSKGDNGSPAGFDRGHHGPSNWLFDPQWGRDHLLPSKVSLIIS